MNKITNPDLLAEIEFNKKISELEKKFNAMVDETKEFLKPFLKALDKVEEELGLEKMYFSPYIYKDNIMISIDDDEEHSKFIATIRINYWYWEREMFSIRFDAVERAILEEEWGCDLFYEMIKCIIDESPFDDINLDNTVIRYSFEYSPPEIIIERFYDIPELEDL